MDAPACWICLQEAEDSLNPLVRVCACPRTAHAKCVARWQLQSAGRPEEKNCRFCAAALPDWRSQLLPEGWSGGAAALPPPTIAVHFHGQVSHEQLWVD